jgi:hypothetical protein
MGWLPIDAAERLHDGRFKAYGWGGIDIVFLTDRQKPLCPHCASELEKPTEENEGDRIEHGTPAMVGGHESGDPIECERCGHTMRPLYE